MLLFAAWTIVGHPLELREDSRLGVPGLLHAIRSGKVSVINAPGSGVLENSAFPAFMHTISRYFLGEELIMPSIATWWCGHKKELDSVLENLDKLIIKKANRKQKFRSVYGQLSKEEYPTSNMPFCEPRTNT